MASDASFHPFRLLAVLAIPVNVHFKLDGEQPLSSNLSISWLFGLLHKNFIAAKLQADGEISSIASAERKRSGQVGTAVALLRTRGLMRRILILFRDLWSALSFRSVILLLHLGPGDPPKTGVLFASTVPFTLYPGAGDRISIRIEPDFLKGRLWFLCEGDLRVIPLLLVWALFSFMVSVPLLRALKNVLVVRNQGTV